MRYATCLLSALLGMCCGGLVAPATSARRGQVRRTSRRNPHRAAARSSVVWGHRPGRRRSHPALLPGLRAGGGALSDAAKVAAEEDGLPGPGAGGPVVEYAAAGDAPPLKAVVLVDCFCPYLGLYVAERIKRSHGGDTEHRVAVVHVLSDYLRLYSLATDPDNADQWEAARMPRPDDVDAWKARVGAPGEAVEWVGVYAESDSGLDDAERLRHMLNVTCQDDPTVLPDRRHKFLMNERVRRVAGLPTVRQRLCRSPGEAKDFARELLESSSSSRRAVVKPHRGCGTESVALCDSVEQVIQAWHDITSTKVFGTQDPHTTVLVQEFLEGTEFAVDVVARDGHYKVAAVWRYDKRPANGGSFVYFGTHLVDAESDLRVPAVIEYVEASLRALGVRWGISHNEVIVTSDRGPVLVEVNCRQHNMDFAPITMACLGYNALDMLVDALLEPDPDVWHSAYPDVPRLEAAGAMVHLVCYAHGRLREVHHLEEIGNLESAFNMEVYPHFAAPGAEITPTTDIRSDAGWVQLVHDDPARLQEDYEAIVQRMPSMFDVEDAPPA